MKKMFFSLNSFNKKMAACNRCGELLRQLILFPILRRVVPLQVRGLDHLEFAGYGPFILAPNHSSHLDTLVLLAALPPRLRLQIKVAAAADYFFDQRWKGALLSLLLNAFPFARKGPGCEASLQQARRLLESGQSLLIFPEGTRSANGQLQPFKRGVGKLAVSTSARVIPVWIEGTCQSLPKGARVPRRYPVTVTFGPPLRFGPSADPDRVARSIEQQVRLLGPGGGLQGNPLVRGRFLDCDKVQPAIVSLRR